MVEFTEEQETEVQRRILESAKFERWRMAFVQGVRLVFPYIEGLSDQYDPQTNQLIKKGVIDPFVVLVFKQECNKIIEDYFPQPPQPITNEPVIQHTVGESDEDE